MRGLVLSRLRSVLTGIIVIGVVVYLVLIALTAQAVSAELKEVSSVRYDVVNNMVVVEFVVKIVNNGLIDIEVEKLYYEVYVEGNYLGYGVKENIIIHRGENEISLTLKAPPSSILKTLLLTLTRDKVEVTVKGKISFPIKSFGVIKLWTAEVPFEKTVTAVFERT